MGMLSRQLPAYAHNPFGSLPEHWAVRQTCAWSVAAIIWKSIHRKEDWKIDSIHLYNRLHPCKLLLRFLLR